MSFSPPSDSSMMFSGLISRWMMPARCSAATALVSLSAICESGRERHRRQTTQPLLQCLALVVRQHSIEAAASFGGRFQRLGDERAAHMTRDPHLAQQRRAQQRIESRTRLRKLQHDFAIRLAIARAEHAHVLPVGQHLAELVVVDHRAARGRAAQRLLADGELHVGELRRRQREDIEHDGRAVVRIGARRGLLDELARGLVRRGAPRQQRMDLLAAKARHARRRCRAGSDRASARFP